MKSPQPDPAERALALAREAARRAGLDAAGAEVLRVAASIHVELPRADVVARVEGPGRQGLALRQVLVARTLAARDAPVARLVQPEIQPFLIGDGAITLWRRLRPVATPTFEAVGGAVRALHEATAQSLPTCADFAGLGWKNHGEHVLGYVNDGGAGGGAPAHRHDGTFAAPPGASFCIPQAQSPGQ